MESNVGTTGGMPGTQVVTHMPINMVQVAPEAPHPAANHKKAFIVIGAMQISIGILSIILGGAVMGVYPVIYYPAYGIWSGVWFIVCGSLALATGKSPNSCNVIAGLVVSILTCLEAFAIGIAEAILAAAYLCFGFVCYLDTVHIGLHGTLAFLAFVEFITAIVHSAYCCSGSCGGGARQGAVIANTTTYVNTPGMQPQFPVQQAYAQPQYNPQPMVVQSQPAQMTGYPSYAQQTSPPVYGNEKQAI